MLKIRPFKKEDLIAIRRFTDHEIGVGYYSEKELEEIFTRSSKNNIMCSLLLENEKGQILGVRISYPPGNWEQGKGSGLYSEKWPHSLSETAYFQSLFISKELQGQGWGGRLSCAALLALKEVGAKGVVCHSWKESPNDSSTRYLKKLGFEFIEEHPEYWKGVDYFCTRCGKPPCRCTALEMYLSLTGEGKL
jgi:ribosomal protein S18 acetylase RimI-like enzyme